MKNTRMVWGTGFMATAVYLACTLASFLKFPHPYSPFTNWLSDLGNPILNPDGALIYDLGCVLTGLCLTFFSLALEIWKDGDNKPGSILTIAQLTGVLASLALIVTAIFPLGAHTLLHQISGKAHIALTGFFLTFSATVFLKHPRTPNGLAYFGFFAALINFIYGAILYSVFVAEWAAIGLFILYVLMISWNSFTQRTLPVEPVAHSS